MFKDYEGKVISISNKLQSKTKKLEVEIQTTFEEIDFYNEEVQTPERFDKLVQTEYKEILSSENLNFNEKNLQAFLNKVYFPKFYFIIFIRLSS
jgi:hypothetical protein